MSFQKILIAFDDSPFSQKAAEAGLQLALQLNATAGIIYVVESSKEIGNPDLGILPEDATAAKKKSAKEMIAGLQEKYRLPQPIEVFMPEGTPEDQILASIKDWSADLIVMGSHGHTGLLHLLTGSITEHLIRNAAIPMLLIPKCAG